MYCIYSFVFIQKDVTDPVKLYSCQLQAVFSAFQRGYMTVQKGVVELNLGYTTPS